MNQDKKEQPGGGSDHYKEQLMLWRELFKKEGKAVCAPFLRGDLTNERFYMIRYFCREYLLDFKTGALLSGSGKAPADLDVLSQMMIYSYLKMRHPGAVRSGHMVGYEQIRGNRHISGWAALIRDALSGLARALDTNEADIARVVSGLGGESEGFGDCSFTLHAFDDVPLTYIYWRGDEEFPSRVNVLFDSNILDFIHQESVVTLSDCGAKLLLTTMHTRDKSTEEPPEIPHIV